MNSADLTLRIIVVNGTLENSINDDTTICTLLLLTTFDYVWNMYHVIFLFDKVWAISGWPINSSNVKNHVWNHCGSLQYKAEFESGRQDHKRDTAYDNFWQIINITKIKGSNRIRTWFLILEFSEIEFIKNCRDWARI